MAGANGSGKAKRKVMKGGRHWYLVTNHLNMMYMLAAGLVMGPLGFRGRHYSDCLSLNPGKIPLFADDKPIPADAIEIALADEKHLVPCIACFELSGLDAPVSLLKADGILLDGQSPPKRRSKKDIAMLVSAPLPLGRLTTICFRSDEDRNVFINMAGLVSNVDIMTEVLDVDASLFETTEHPISTAQQTTLTDKKLDAPSVIGDAQGGVLTMLYHIANGGGLALELYKDATGCGANEVLGGDRGQRDKILAKLPDWIDGSRQFDGSEDPVRLYWGVVDAIVDSKNTGQPTGAVDVVLTYLGSQLTTLSREAFVPRLQGLIEDIRDLSGLRGKRISELMQDHKGSFSRALVLFSTHETSEDLLASDYGSAEDPEFILAAVLFGVRDGWLKTPAVLRPSVLIDYITHRMAQAEANAREASLGLDMPAAPEPLCELFRREGGLWSQLQSEQAFRLAAECNWNECFATTIRLPEGDWPAVFERQGEKLVLQGRISVEETFDQGAFLSRLGKWPPAAPEVEASVRAILES